MKNRFPIESIIFNTIFGLSLLAFLLCSCQIVYSQSFVNFGTNILINGPSTTPIATQKNAITVFGDYINEIGGLNGGTIEQDGGTIAIRGNWYNNASNTVFTTNLGTNNNGFVLFDGGVSTVQHISGISPTKFENLVVLNSRKILDVDNNLVNGRLILNSIFELNGNRFIINNPNNNAINYLGGFIKSESLPSQYGIVQWNINNSLGLFNLPFGNDIGASGSNLDFSINVKTPMNVGDFLSFATYPTDIFNEPLPTASTPLELEVRSVVDRFWVIQSSNPALNPDCDLTFEFTSDDLNPSYNTINLNRLKASRNNTLLGTWSDFEPKGIQTGNKIVANNINGSDLFENWTLVNTPESLADLFIPDGFSPNGDGNNDIFKPVFNPDYEIMDYKLFVYNRWGQIVFSTAEVSEGWDGTIKNSDSEPMVGVYTWLIILKGRNKETKSGTGTTKRFNGRITLIK